MKVVKEGKAHIRDIYEAECDFCESIVKVVSGDPMAKVIWSGHNDVLNKMRFICPVCGQRNMVYTTRSCEYHGLTVFKKQILSKEEKTEVESWKDFVYPEDMSNDDWSWISSSSF